MSARFEGSYLGDAARLPPGARMECKICWHVYDPAQGCDHWQVPPGTPFVALPDEWRCPKCDGDREQFMLLDVVDGMETAPAVCATPAPSIRNAPVVPAAVTALEAAFREIHSGQMRGVPLVNEALAVKAVGFRRWEDRWLGALITPWFLNLVLLPGEGDDWSGLVTGEKELIEFPSGTYQFVHAHRDTVGGYKACSLFSPVFNFTNMLQATETAAAALVSLFDPSIREEGARTGEIRQMREAELAGASTDAKPATDTPAQTETSVKTEGAEPAAPSRRALFGLSGGSSEASNDA